MHMCLMLAVSTRSNGTVRGDGVHWVVTAEHHNSFVPVTFRTCDLACSGAASAAVLQGTSQEPAHGCSRTRESEMKG